MARINNMNKIKEDHSNMLKCCDSNEGSSPMIGITDKLLISIDLEACIPTEFSEIFCIKSLYKGKRFVEM